MQCLKILLLQKYQAGPQFLRYAWRGYLHLVQHMSSMGEMQEGPLEEHHCRHHTQFKMSMCLGIGR